MRVVDQYTTDHNLAADPINGQIAYTTATGNVPQGHREGRGDRWGVCGDCLIRLLRFSAAYNDAYYDSFPNSAQPVENGYTGCSTVSVTFLARRYRALTSTR